MSRGSRWFVWLAVVAVAGSGAVYGVMRYALEPVDEWAVVNHPWQPHLQHVHVVTAPLLVFAGGLLWRDHVRRKLEEGRTRGRWSGLAMVASFAPMVGSGVLIQAAVQDGWRTGWIVVHVASSVLWMAALAGHPLFSRSPAIADGERPQPELPAAISDAADPRPGDEREPAAHGRRTD